MGWSEAYREGIKNPLIVRGLSKRKQGGLPYLSFLSDGSLETRRNDTVKPSS